MATPNHPPYYGPRGPGAPQNLPYPSQPMPQNLDQQYNQNRQQYSEAPPYGSNRQPEPMGRPPPQDTRQPGPQYDDRQWTQENRDPNRQLRGSRSVATLNSTYAGPKQRQVSQPLIRDPRDLNPSGRRPPDMDMRSQNQRVRQPPMNQPPQPNAYYNTPNRDDMATNPEQPPQQPQQYQPQQYQPQGPPQNHQQYQQSIPPQVQTQQQPQFQPPPQGQYAPSQYQSPLDQQQQLQFNQPVQPLVQPPMLPPMQPPMQQPMRSQTPQGYQHMPPSSQQPPQNYPNRPPSQQTMRSQTPQGYQHIPPPSQQPSQSYPTRPPSQQTMRSQTPGNSNGYPPSSQQPPQSYPNRPPSQQTMQSQIPENSNGYPPPMQNPQSRTLSNPGYPQSNGSQDSFRRPQIQKSSTFPINNPVSGNQNITPYSNASISSVPTDYANLNQSMNNLNLNQNNNNNISTTQSVNNMNVPKKAQSELGSHPIPLRQYVEGNKEIGSSSKINTKPDQLQYMDFDRLRTKAQNNPQDNNIQFEYAKALAEAIHTLADKIGNNGQLIKHGKVDPKDVRKTREHWATQSLRILRRLASNQHHAPAMYFLGTLYGTGGLGLEKDYEKAYELYHKSAKMDYGPAMYRTAVCNEVGAGVKRDNMKAINWLKKASARGEGAAMYKLGMINLYGLMGQPRSFAEAVQWLMRASSRADAENPHSLHEIGRLYETADTIKENHNSDYSQIIPHDIAKALDYYLQAAKLGYSPSQYKLGWCYEYGELACPVDPKRSIGWYSRAAAQGEAESAMALSGWYLTGAEGVLTPSDTEAYLWARKAAEKGLAKAEYALGYFSEVGLGVKADLEEAKRWYYKAASQKHPKAIKKIQELRH